MKHKWKSKLSETGSVFKINHHSNFAKSVLEPSLIDFSFDEYEFFIGTHRVPIKMPITVMSLPVVLLKHIVSNKCKGDNLVKAAQHVLVAQVSLLVKNELQDTKLLAASDTFHKRYQEVQEGTMANVLKDVAAGVCYGSYSGLDSTALLTAGTFMDEFISVYWFFARCVSSGSYSGFQPLYLRSSPHLYSLFNLRGLGFLR
ncbi:hypothetical protein YC2023_102165 [Brassica napus]